MELAADELTLKDASGLWDSQSGRDTESEIADLVSSGHKAIHAITSDAKGWRDGSLAEDSLVEGLIRIMLQQTANFSAMALYSAKALSDLLQTLTEAHGVSTNLEERFIKLGVSKATSATVFPAIAFMTGFGGGSRLVCCGYQALQPAVSDIAGAFP